MFYFTFRYSLQLAGEGTAALATNPEAKGSPSSSSSTTGVPTASVVTAQQFTLRSISNKLKNAYNGLDVEWSENGNFYFTIFHIHIFFVF